MPDDVVVPKFVEHQLRRVHPPDQFDAKMEEARGYYRQAREGRRQELAELRKPDPWGPPEIKPTGGQVVRIQAHKANKKRWAVIKRKKARKRRYPANRYPAGYPSEVSGSEAMAKSADLVLSGFGERGESEVESELVRRSKRLVAVRHSNVAGKPLAKRNVAKSLDRRGIAEVRQRHDTKTAKRWEPYRQQQSTRRALAQHHDPITRREVELRTSSGLGNPDPEDTKRAKAFDRQETWARDMSEEHQLESKKKTVAWNEARRKYAKTPMGRGRVSHKELKPIQTSSIDKAEISKWKGLVINYGNRRRKRLRRRY